MMTHRFSEKRSPFDDQRYITCQFGFISGTFEKRASCILTYFCSAIDVEQRRTGASRRPLHLGKHSNQQPHCLKSSLMVGSGCGARTLFRRLRNLRVTSHARGNCALSVLNTGRLTSFKNKPAASRRMR